jgi:hypothetical protein
MGGSGVSSGMVSGMGLLGLGFWVMGFSLVSSRSQ